MKRNTTIFLIFLFILLSSIISAISIIINNNDITYWLISFLPLSFSLILLVNYNFFSKITSRLSVFLLIACYYTRMVILPIIFVYSNYSSLTINQEYSRYIKYAVLLAIYEFLIVSVFLNIFDKNKIKQINKRKESTYTDSTLETRSGNKFISYIIFMLFIIVLVAILIYPQFKSYFRFIFEGEIDKVNLQNINFEIMKTSIPARIYWIVIFIIDILQVMLPIVLINYVKKIKMHDNTKFILSLIIIGLVALISTPETARSIIIALALCLILIKLYPKQKRKLIIIISCCLIPAIFYGLFIKTRISYSANEISNTLNAYFSGISNIATSFLIPNRPNLVLLFNDVMHSIPFVMAFFKDATTTTVLFNNALYNKAGIHNQIIPMVSQSLCYFGFIIAPLVSYFSEKISLVFENRYNNVNDIYIKYLELLFTIYFAVAPIIYNFSILTSITLGVLIPCMIIARIKFLK